MSLASPSSSYKVLLIEDEPDLLELFGEILEREGYQVKACPSFAQAKEQLFSGKFDALVTDWQLNDKKMDLILMDPVLGKSLPKVVIILSAYSGSEMFPEELLKRFKVFEKPFDMNELLKILAVQLAAP